MTVVDFHCSEVSHARHLLPVWRALPDHLRGTFTAHPHPAGWLDARGVPVEVARRPPAATTPTVVASFADLGDSRGRPLALVEHGAGQTYAGYDSGGYPGGPDREPVSLFLCPSDRVAGLNAARYPTARTVVVGVPALDGRWQHRPTVTADALAGRPTVGVSFHWAADFPVPEGRPAWPAYVKHLARIADRLDGRVLGHGHPRAIARYAKRYADAGIEVVDDFDALCERVDVYAVDISSTGFEAAARGIPVVWLDAPWYRPDAGHGLRWGPEGRAVGWPCPGPDELPAVARLASLEAWHPTHLEVTRRALEAVYSVQDDRAAERSAAEIAAWAPTATPTSTRPHRYGQPR